MEKNKSKKNIIIAVSVVIILAIASVVGSRIAYVSKNTKKFSNVILPGVKVEDIDLSGKSKDEAKAILKTKFGDEVLKKKINVSANNKTYTIDYVKLAAKYNIEDTVNQAYSYGRGLGVFPQYDLIKNPKEVKLSLKFGYDPKYIKEMITSIEKDVNKTAINGKISLISEGKFSVIPDVKGAKLLSDKLEKDIILKIDGKLSLDTNSDTKIVAEVEEVKAERTEEKLATVDTKISTFSTDFTSSISERANNIVVASKSINSSLIMPGASFSFNDIVGIRTAARGYMSAGIIVGNKVESGLGGGICQVSGTLYNAMLKTNIKSTERAHHTLPSSYVGKGLDATIDYGNIDYKFVNTNPYPIYIEATTINRKLTFNIYSNATLTKRTYEVYTEVYETIQPKTNEVPDATLKLGDRVIDQIAYQGYKVKTYRRTIENGAIISTELISNDYYKEVDGIVKVGTKKS